VDSACQTGHTSLRSLTDDLDDDDPESEDGLHTVLCLAIRADTLYHEHLLALIAREEEQLNALRAAREQESRHVEALRRRIACEEEQLNALRAAREQESRHFVALRRRVAAVSAQLQTPLTH